MKPKLRCAIYTRKSSDEGLDQAFNSLHAQREACEAFIASQAGEGWRLVRTAYDDGGFSGGNMDRPALRRLLEDIQAGLVDTVVVYKVDRLTRSLGDFARIVETFDKAGASFVSITQAFNTTTSMGRLTLNVLLSFAQFEREVTGERIRDKIAQSKAKGMWMGGNLPLGYDAGDHVLVVNPVEALVVRMIFERYLELRSVYALKLELESVGVRSKKRTTHAGKEIGGERFSRGALYHLLQNRHYRGEICHKGKSFPGLHLPIIDAELFDRVQALIAENRVARREPKRSSKAGLTGLVFNRDGAPFSPSFSRGKGGKRYRYYVCQAAPKTKPDRLPAEEFEKRLVDMIGRFADRQDLDLATLSTWMRRIEVRPNELRLTLSAELVFGADHRALALGDLTRRLHPDERAVVDEGEQAVLISVPMRLSFRGGQTWRSASDAGGLQRRQANAPIVRALREAHVLLARLGASPLGAGKGHGSGEAPLNTYQIRLTRLAFLAPDLQQDILAGRCGEGLGMKAILKGDIPVEWQDQRRWFADFQRSAAGMP